MVHRSSFTSSYEAYDGVIEHRGLTSWNTWSGFVQLSLLDGRIGDTIAVVADPGRCKLLLVAVK